MWDEISIRKADPNERSDPPWGRSCFLRTSRDISPMKKESGCGGK